MTSNLIGRILLTDLRCDFKLFVFIVLFCQFFRCYCSEWNVCGFVCMLHHRLCIAVRWELKELKGQPMLSIVESECALRLWFSKFMDCLFVDNILSSRIKLLTNINIWIPINLIVWHQKSEPIVKVKTILSRYYTKIFHLCTRVRVFCLISFERRKRKRTIDCHA